MGACAEYSVHVGKINGYYYDEKYYDNETVYTSLTSSSSTLSSQWTARVLMMIIRSRNGATDCFDCLYRISLCTVVDPILARSCLSHIIIIIHLSTHSSRPHIPIFPGLFLQSPSVRLLPCCTNYADNPIGRPESLSTPHTPRPLAGRDNGWMEYARVVQDDYGSDSEPERDEESN